jgi:uncharacterized RDD family membrane protein YckC
VSIAIGRDDAPPATLDGAAGAAAMHAGVVAGVAPRYVGLVTRAIAFGLDAAIVNGIAIVTAAVVSLTFAVLSLPDELNKLAVAAGGVAYGLWAVGYFVTFWSTTGQTPGNRALRICVRTASGDRMRPRRALLRFAALMLAALPLFAGFLLILVDNRRRGLHDVLARTVVIEAGDGAVASGSESTRSRGPAR